MATVDQTFTRTRRRQSSSHTWPIARRHGLSGLAARGPPQPRRTGAQGNGDPRGPEVPRPQAGESTVEVTELEPDWVFGPRVHSSAVPWRFRFSLEGEGGLTRVDFHMEGEPGGFFRLAEPLSFELSRSSWRTPLQRSRSSSKPPSASLPARAATSGFSRRADLRRGGESRASAIALPCEAARRPNPSPKPVPKRGCSSKSSSRTAWSRRSCRPRLSSRPPTPSV
jgi:hypothetical protein